MPAPLKVLFLGSGPIAAPILQALAASKLVNLCGVATQPDRPAGRKRIPTPTPLGAAAAELGIDALRVHDVNGAEFMEYAAALAPDMICVVSFGQILKVPLLELPRFNCINVHASLLPRYRGASPIAQCLLNRDNATGVAFMQMEKGLDSGAVYKMLELPLKGIEYADSLEIRLGELAASVAAETLCDIAAGKLIGTPQDQAKVTICRKISKRDGRIDWNDSAADIEAMSRAYYPWPGALCEVRLPGGRETVLNICKARVLSATPLAPGEIAELAGKLVIGCGKNSALEIDELIPAGAKRTTAAAFRNGLRGELPEVLQGIEI